MAEEEKSDREQKLESLEDATKRLHKAEAAKKRDAKLHKENCTAIQDEISDILEALDKGIE